MRKPEFDQFRQSTLRHGKPLPQQLREPYRLAIVKLLEDTGQVFVQRARKDGHDDALIEIHGSWVGTEFSADTVMETIRKIWPGDLFPASEMKYWMEADDEIVTLEFAWDKGESQFLTGRVKIVA